MKLYSIVSYHLELHGDRGETQKGHTALLLIHQLHIQIDIAPSSCHDDLELDSEACVPSSALLDGLCCSSGHCGMTHKSSTRL